jgi:hypothetical protein
VSHDPHSLPGQGFRYCASPCRTQARWLHPTEYKVLHPDWQDITDLSGEQMIEFFANTPAQAQEE